jgi:glutamate racemase
VDRPIGLFDSGVGGLSVWREIRARLPAEDLIYVADEAYVPYGTKSVAEIQQRSTMITRYLLTQNIKALVVACNTATAAAIHQLREQFSLPIIGVEPAVKPAAQETETGVVGVLATPNTLASEKFSDLVSRFNTDVRVMVQPCVGWVDLVEQGEWQGQYARDCVAAHVEPLLSAGADVLVLGCTHFPFLLPLIRRVAGPHVRILESGAAIARQLENRLQAERLECDTGHGHTRFVSSGDTHVAAAKMARVLGCTVVVDALCDVGVA